MIDTSRIDLLTAKSIQAALAHRSEQEKALNHGNEVLDWYTKNYEFVQLVRCLSCGENLCLWVLDKNQFEVNRNIHHQGLRRIELGDKLLSTRKRHDGVMGYQCVCGASTLLSSVEQDIVPQAKGIIPADQPHYAAMVQKRMIAENFKPNVKHVDDKVITDDLFEHAVVKRYRLLEY